MVQRIMNAFALAITISLAGVVVLPAQDGDMPPSCRVLRIIDGDTFECDIGGVKQSIRLLGVDAPESRQAPYGKQATAELAKLLRLRSEVILDLDVRERDSRGRLLAYVWNKDAVLVNEALLARGFAIVYLEPPNVKYDRELRRAAKTAQSKRLGLWATEAFACAPADFRQKRCS